MKMTLASKIIELKKKRAKLVEEIKSIATAELETETENPDFDVKKAALAALTKAITRAEEADEIKADEADDEDADTTADDEDEDADNDEKKSKKNYMSAYKKSNVLLRMTPQFDRTKNMKGGDQVARFIIAQHVAKNWGLKAAVEYAREKLGDEMVAKAIQSNVNPGGGSLVPASFLESLISLLYAQAVVTSMGCRTIEMPTANMTLPRMSTGAMSYWIEEGQDITVSQQNFDDIQMFAKKLVSMVPISSDLLRRSPLSVEAEVRRDMMRQMTLALDNAFINGAVTSPQGSPVGLVNWASPANVLTFAAPGATNPAALDQAFNVLEAAELALASQNTLGDNCGWIMPPSVPAYLSTLTDSVGNRVFQLNMKEGTLNGYKYKTTTQIPTNLGTISPYSTFMVFANFDDVIIGNTLNMVSDASGEGAYISGGSLVSPWSRDQTVYRTIGEFDINVAHPESVCVVNVTGWSPTNYTVQPSTAYNTQTALTAGSAAVSADPTNTDLGG